MSLEHAAAPCPLGYPYWRNTLTEWSSLLAEAGFLIRRLYEPRPSAEQVQRQPQLRDCDKLPYFLIVDLIKLGQSGT